MYQTSSDGNQTTSTLSITLNRSDSGRKLICKAYNNAVAGHSIEDGWQLDIQCKFFIVMYIYLTFFLIYRNKNLCISEK